MRRVGQTSMRESVSLEKVTEFIVDGGRWNRPDRKKRRPRDQNERAQSDPTQGFAARQSRIARAQIFATNRANWGGMTFARAPRIAISTAQ